MLNIHPSVRVLDACLHPRLPAPSLGALLSIYSVGSVSALLMTMESLAHCSCSSVETQFSIFLQKILPSEPSLRRCSAFYFFRCVRRRFIWFGFDKFDQERVNDCAHSLRPLTLITRTTCALFYAIYPSPPIFAYLLYRLLLPGLCY